MISRTSLFVVALSGAVLLSVSAPAHAQDDPRKAQAEALFQEGLKLHDKDREAEALEKFQKSYVIYPSPSTLVSIGREEQLLGRPLDALRRYRQALKQPLLNPKYAQMAKQYIGELEIRFGKVSLTGPSGTKLSIYGETLRLPLDEPLDVEPGTVLLHGDHDGKLLEGTVLAVAGKVVVLELREKPDAASAKAPEEPARGPRVTEPPPEERSSSRTSMGYVVPIGFGIAALAAAGAGVAFASSSRSAEDDARAFRSSGACAPGNDQCARVRSFVDDASSRATWSYVFYGASLALVAGAVVSWVAWPTKKREAAVSPVITPTGAGFFYATRF
jgi:hypothetical protein